MIQFLNNFREYTKKAVIGLDDKICQCRWAVSDFSCVLYNHILSKVKLERNATMSLIEESQVSFCTYFCKR